MDIPLFTGILPPVTREHAQKVYSRATVQVASMLKEVFNKAGTHEASSPGRYVAVTSPRNKSYSVHLRKTSSWGQK